eukprot:CAMPEP_0118635794 /NCGR_PEP_ID=MMETSP0785-20121206/2265_1 /TAXON_ID=91992 /ORGANISM="Bolidomonas pacifica, Strain CCMP 1866" /LENGTH=213 /DNA_ID=CAMNT_0006526849 /DNA_START=33 /DNA_END=671 /DNA_ORIENTATION=-
MTPSTNLLIAFLFFQFVLCDSLLSKVIKPTSLKKGTPSVAIATSASISLRCSPPSQDIEVNEHDDVDACRMLYAREHFQEVSLSLFTHDERPIILFDGLCNLCNAGVNFALDNDSAGHFRFASLQSAVGRSLLLSLGKEPNDISSIVLVTSADSGYFKSDAVLRISRGLDSPIYRAFGALSLALTPRLVRNAVYGLVSKNRYRMFGSSDSCRL